MERPARSRDAGAPSAGRGEEQRLAPQAIHDYLVGMNSNRIPHPIAETYERELGGGTADAMD